MAKISKQSICSLGHRGRFTCHDGMNTPAERNKFFILGDRLSLIRQVRTNKFEPFGLA